MITGEELVGDLAKTIEDSTGKIISYEIRKPHILQFQPMGGGKLGLAFVPWTLSNPELDTVIVPASAVIFKFSPSGNVEGQFIQQTSSIQIASTI